ncbi:MAG: hypothetical protein PHN56_02245 [Candidatus Nanoarchaeia archaeon]|nr:hypothetical protein [Candidatus Nanoarchaeia archaeon]
MSIENKLSETANSIKNKSNLNEIIKMVNDQAENFIKNYDSTSKSYSSIADSDPRLNPQSPKFDTTLYLNTKRHI